MFWTQENITCSHIEHHKTQNTQNAHILHIYPYNIINSIALIILLPSIHPFSPAYPTLAPLDVEGQRLYSKLLPDDRTPHPISKGAPRHPAEETHFSRLYTGSYSFGHDPKFTTIGEGRNVD